MAVPTAPAATPNDLTIGLISDTHGLLRPQALAALAGCRQILHAGDVGGAGILEQLRQIAPVVAVRGNNDRDAWAASLPETVDLQLGGVRIHMLHDLKTLAIDAGTADVVVAGHSHRPSVVERDGTLLVNPGSAGPRRFRLPVSIALLAVHGGRPEVTIVALAID